MFKKLHWQNDSLCGQTILFRVVVKERLWGFITLLTYHYHSFNQRHCGRRVFHRSMIHSHKAWSFWREVCFLPSFNFFLTMKSKPTIVIHVRSEVQRSLLFKRSWRIHSLIPNYSAFPQQIVKIQHRSSKQSSEETVNTSVSLANLWESWFDNRCISSFDESEKGGIAKVWAFCTYHPVVHASACLGGIKKRGGVGSFEKLGFIR